jgi:hypothetical protein
MPPRDQVTAVAAGIAIASAVLAIGGAPRWSLALIAAAVAVAIAAQLTSRRGLVGVPPVLALVGIAAGLTIAQAVPLPASAQATLAPTNHELIEEGHALLGDDAPRWMPLSVDPPGTRRAALDLTLALAVGWVLVRISSSQRGRYAVLASVGAACGLAAAAGAIDHLLGATSVYGLYTPRRATPPILGPLLNANSYGSLCVLGAMVSAGLALQGSRSTALRAAWALNVVLCLVVAFATLSRGAAIAAGVGAVTFAAAWLSGRRRHEKRERSRAQLFRVGVPSAIVVVCGVALVVLTSAGNVARQIESTSFSEYQDPLSKYAAWRSSEQLVRENPWIGVGRGGFETAFTRIHPESAFGTFSHLENEYLQAVVDWGIPGAAALMVAAGWLALVGWRRRRDGALAAGALGGLAAIAAQSAVDFGLELPGLLIPAVAVAATVSYVPLREMTTPRVRRSYVPRLALLALVAVLVVAVVPSWGSTVTEDHDALMSDDPEPTLDDAKAAMRSHPLDYFAPARVAVVQFATGDPSAVKFLNHAMVLHPTLPDLHRIAALTLAASGHVPQARLEFQLAMRYTQYPLRLVGEILSTFPKTDDAAAALWIDFPSPDLMVRILASWKRQDVALRYLEAMIAHARAEKRPIDVASFDLLASVAKAVNDPDALESAARQRLDREPSLTSRLGLGRILEKRGKYADAEQVLAVETRGPPAQEATTKLLLCQVVFEQKRLPDAERCLRTLMESPNLTVPMLRDIHGRLAAIDEARGDTTAARMERGIVQGLSQ